ncbi:hypothetical protein L1987_33122 [Smallanthus sonchifolius]|uniref:Uncharacterized protein n=1 Tax=Smallanthus sonchifolius TaxID=185202 RepID=A0ACB9HPH0_9ASTR|nr:hypothetical protein L1987_33122 [Smallanthus sonchifolius]
MTLGANGLHGWLSCHLIRLAVSNSFGVGFDPGCGKSNSLERSDLVETKIAMKFLAIMIIPFSIFILLSVGWGFWFRQGSSNIVFKGLIGLGRDRFLWMSWMYDTGRHYTWRIDHLRHAIAVTPGPVVCPLRRPIWIIDNQLIKDVINRRFSWCCSREFCWNSGFWTQAIWVLCDLGMSARLARWWWTTYKIASTVKRAQQNSGFCDGYQGCLGTPADIWKLMELDLAHVKILVGFIPVDEFKRWMKTEKQSEMTNIQYMKRSEMKKAGILNRNLANQAR